MANRNVLNHLLQPVDPADNGRWRAFLNTVRDDIMWNPNFDGFLGDMDRDFGNLGGDHAEPSAQIWTSTLPKPEFNMLLKEGALLHYFDRNIILLDHMELQTRNWDYANHAEYQHMNDRERLITAKFLKDKAYIAGLRQLQGQRTQAIQQRGGIRSLFKAKPINKIVAILKAKPWMYLTGKIYLCQIKHEVFGEVTIRNVIFAFIQDKVFMKVFVIKGGLELAVVA